MVATFNDSRQQDSKRFNEDFLNFCDFVESSSGVKGYLTNMIDFAINLVNHSSPGDFSLHYIDMAPTTSISIPTNCEALSSYLRPFHVNRQRCQDN